MVKDPRAKIVYKENWDEYFLISIKSPLIAAQAKPGQFIMVKVSNDPHPILRRPLSIHSRAEDTIQVFFQVVGLGTKILARSQVNNYLDILGPLGGGFSISSDLKGKRIFAVGGGRGIAPLNFLAQELIALEANVKIFYGGNTQADLCLKDTLMKNGFDVLSSTEDGSFGHKGLVTELLEKELENSHPDFLFSCGPDAMMQKIARITTSKKIRAEFSLEAHMGCGFGVCWSCVKRIRKNGEENWSKICEEGPVFSGEEIVW
jgi:dihydroorotate dehydrogenase electron transfer subunit